MNFHDLVKTNRSYRKFDERNGITREQLLAMVDCARLTPSSVNIQPFRYFLSCDAKTNDKIFPHTKWARLLKGYDGPAQGERPTAYIIVAIDQKIAPNTDRFLVDLGIVSQTIMLSAVEQGFGGCMIKNFVPADLAASVALEDRYLPMMILALGKPDEPIVLEEISADQKTSYYRDENNIHHVPKRKLHDIVL